MAISGRGRFNIITQDDFGNIVPGASVEIRNEAEADLSLASLFSDRDGLVPISNPLTSDADGYAFAYAAIGYYQVKVTGAGRERTLRDVEVGQLSSTGPTGAAGIPGLEFAFSDSTATGVDPGNGNVRLNNATLASVTEIAISYTGTSGADFEALIKTWDDSTSTANRGQLLIKSSAAPANYTALNITSVIIDGTTYGRFTVSHADSAGTLADTIPLSIEFARTGNLGTPGLDGTDAVVTALPENFATNPIMRFSQENGTATSTANGFFAADQYEFVQDNDGTITVGLVASATPEGGDNRTRVTVTANDATLAGDQFAVIRQRLEGELMRQFQFGTANAVDMVVRFGWNGPAGTYTVALQNAAANRSYVREFTATGSDQVVTVVFPGDTSGTWPVTAAHAMTLTWSIAAGTNFDTTADAWQTGAFVSTAGAANGIGANSDEHELFDVGIYADPSSSGVAPEFVVPEHPKDLARCQRYWRPWGSRAQGIWLSATVARLQEELRVPMRTTPTAAIISSTPTIEKWGIANRVGTGSTVSNNNSTADDVDIQIDGFAGSALDDPAYSPSNLVNLSARL